MNDGPQLFRAIVVGLTIGLLMCSMLSQGRFAQAACANTAIAATRRGHSITLCGDKIYLWDGKLSVQITREQLEGLAK